MQQGSDDTRQQGKPGESDAAAVCLRAALAQHKREAAAQQAALQEVAEREATLAQRCNVSQAQLDEARAETEALRQRHAAQLSEREAATAEVAELRAQLQVQAKELEDVQQGRDSAVHDLASEKRKLMLALAAEREVAAALQQDVRMLQNKLADARKAAGAASEEAAAAAARHASQKKQLEGQFADAQRAALHAADVAEQQAAEHWRSDQQQAQQELADAQQQLAEAMEDIKAMVEDNDELHDKIEHLEGAMALVREDCTMANTRAAKLQNNLDRAQAGDTQSAQALATVRRELGASLAREARAEAAAALREEELTSALAIAEEARDAEAADAQAAAKKHRAAMRQLQAQLDELQLQSEQGTLADKESMPDGGEQSSQSERLLAAREPAAHLQDDSNGTPCAVPAESQIVRVSCPFLKF
jgi:hypothetical protein